jgi:hypothetical protein
MYEYFIFTYLALLHLHVIYHFRCGCSDCVLNLASPFRKNDKDGPENKNDN